jgi:hypothetical protein
LSHISDRAGYNIVNMDTTLQIKANLLLNRLERISADSPWAHKASGIRASLSKQLVGEDPDSQSIRDLLETGFQILEYAAAEIPDSSEPHNPHND